MHSASAQPVNFPKRSPVDGFAADIRPDGAVADGASTTISGADIAGNGVVSRVPYPTMDQVERSFAIQRLQWLRHLPTPRSAAEKCIFLRIRTLGWNAPE